MKKVKQLGVRLLPIDSEHSAIYQCLEGKNRKDVMNIILTASGGPFLKRSIKNVRKEDVLRHPVWKMGRKITVDSATMMNKGLEVIEAHHLFDFPASMIKVVIHPEAICHSLVQFKDGTMLAQMSTPDMKLPIQYALTAPHRLPSLTPYLDISKVKTLTFLAPDTKKFPCLHLAYSALETGKTMPAVINTANEEAIKLFLDDSIKFHGKLDGKIGGAFSSSGNIGGGNETTIMNILHALLIHGMIVQGTPKGDHYGPVAIKAPDDRSQRLCREYGQRIAKLVRRLSDA